MAKLFGMHEIELHSGVKPEDFERFVVEELNRSQLFPGVATHVLKGDRGEREGKYLFMMEFESTESRDRLFPTPGQASEEAQRYLESTRAITEKWATFGTVPGTTDVSTDYVVVLQDQALGQHGSASK
jgi:hypothetical protein